MTILPNLDEIRKVSKQLDADPTAFQFASLEQAMQVISYRYADHHIIVDTRRRARAPKPEPKFWKKFKPGRQAIKPVNLSDT